jgi:transcription-repair coupling factor (superfamily II helicase)
MPDQADRLSFYTALFSIMRLDEVDEIKEEMEDRFGKTPPIVERVIMTAILRYHASYAMLERIVIQRNRIALILPKGEKESFYKEKFVKLLEYVNVKYSKEVKLVQTNESLKLEMTNKINSPEGILKYLIEFVGELSKIISN